MRDADGRLLRTYNRGSAKIGGSSRTTRSCSRRCLALYEATFEPPGSEAARLAGTIVERFGDPSTAASSRPPRTATAAPRRAPQGPRGRPDPVRRVLGRLRAAATAALTGDHRWAEQALGVIRLLQGVAPQHPQAFGHLLQAMASTSGPSGGGAGRR
jgi:uncharacterized protein YyaL (SSP411 family)